MATALRNNSALAWLSGIDLAPFAQDVFGLSSKKIEIVNKEGNMNNVHLLEQAKITRELTRLRYEALTVKYKSGETKRNRQKEMFRSSASKSNDAYEREAGHTGGSVSRNKRVAPQQVDPSHLKICSNKK